MRDEILNWLINGRVGASSKAMACCLIGLDTDNSHPYDPDDFNRCLLFLDAVPEARQHLDKLRTMSVTWNMLIENWSEIEQCFLDEAGLNWCKAKSAPKTYELMDKIQKAALEQKTKRERGKKMNIKKGDIVQLKGCEGRQNRFHVCEVYRSETNPEDALVSVSYMSGGDNRPVVTHIPICALERIQEE